MRSFYSPLSISAPFYGYLKLLSYTERKEAETRMRDTGIELRTFGRQNLKCKEFTLLFCGVRQRNAGKFMLHDIFFAFLTNRILALCRCRCL